MNGIKDKRWTGLNKKIFKVFTRVSATYFIIFMSRPNLQTRMYNSLIPTTYLTNSPDRQEAVTLMSYYYNFSGARASLL